MFVWRCLGLGRSGAPVIAGDSRQSEHSGPALLLLLPHADHLLVSLAEHQARPLLSPGQSEGGVPRLGDTLQVQLRGSKRLPSEAPALSWLCSLLGISLRRVGILFPEIFSKLIAE